MSTATRSRYSNGRPRSAPIRRLCVHALHDVAPASLEAGDAVPADGRLLEAAGLGGAGGGPDRRVGADGQGRAGPGRCGRRSGRPARHGVHGHRGHPRTRRAGGDRDRHDHPDRPSGRPARHRRTGDHAIAAPDRKPATSRPVDRGANPLATSRSVERLSVRAVLRRLARHAPSRSAE
jgi:hypothetical protein